MIPHANKPKTHPDDSVIPFATVVDPIAKSPAIHQDKDRTRRRRASSSRPTKAPMRKPAKVAAASQEQALSKRIREAFREDADPSQSLADIRGLLIGPVSRLHEARMEEVIAILEESDRTNRNTSRALTERCSDLSEACQSLVAASEETRQRIQQLSADMTAKLQKAEKKHDDNLAELFMLFDRKIEKLTIETNQRIDGLAARTNSNYHALASNVAARIDDLSITTSTSIEQIMAHVENQLAHSKMIADRQRTDQIEAFADGFHDFADRIFALRGTNTR